MILNLQPIVLRRARERASPGAAPAKKLQTHEEKMIAWVQDGKISFAMITEAGQEVLLEEPDPEEEG